MQGPLSSPCCSGNTVRPTLIKSLCDRTAFFHWLSKSWRAREVTAETSILLWPCDTEAAGSPWPLLEPGVVWSGDWAKEVGAIVAEGSSSHTHVVLQTLLEW